MGLGINWGLEFSELFNRREVELARKRGVSEISVSDVEEVAAIPKQKDGACSERDENINQNISNLKNAVYFNVYLYIEPCQSRLRLI